MSSEDWTARGQYVYDALVETAQASQAKLLGFLVGQEKAGAVAGYEPPFIVNAVLVTSGVDTLDGLAQRSDVAYIGAARAYSVPEPDVASPAAIEWGVAKIQADQVWDQFGATGEGVVVANIDTGVYYTHPALVAKYRGNLGGDFDHNYNWYDPSDICSGPEPCDNNDHGTHTMGTMVGDDGGANQIGVAPGARWIAAKGCESSSCSSSALLSSAEWIAAPCPLGVDPPHPSCDAAMRPHIVSNSWGGGDPWYQAVVDAWHAAGITPVFSAGNSGPSSSTIGSPGDYCNVIGVGATDINDNVAGFSSRGPGNFLACTDKPDVSAPGLNVRSSVASGGYASFQGTSMAAPHVAGCVALLLSIEPGLTYDEIYGLLTTTAVDLGAPGFDYDFGYGRIDCFAAASQLSPDFRLSAVPASQDVCAPDAALYTVDVGQISGFSDPVTLSASGAPAGYSASFSVNPVTPPGASELTLSGSAAASAGSYALEILGAAPTSTHTATVGLNLFDAAPGAVALVSPANGTADVDLSPLLTWAGASQGAAYFVEIATDAGFTQVVYTAAEVDTQHRVAASLAPLTMHYWRVRAENPCAAGAFSSAFSFTTRPIPPILLVDDDDNTPDVRSYYTATLDALGLDYDVWDTDNSDNEPDATTLTPYETVLWFTGDEFGGAAGPASAGETALAAWLDSGQKCLFISSQDYVYDRGLTGFMSDYLGLASATSDVHQNSVTGQGAVFGGLGPYSLAYPFSNYSDLLVPDADAGLAFLGDQGDAAVDKDTLAYYTAFLGFPVEALPTPADRQAVLEALFIRCTLTPDFTLQAGPPAQAVCAPDDALFDVAVGQVAGYDDLVALSAAGYPAGATPLFSANPVIPPGSSALTITDIDAATAGAYPILVTGMGPIATHSALVQLDVFSGPPGSPALLTPPDGAGDQPATPTLQWSADANAAGFFLEIATDPSFDNIAYSANETGSSHTVATSLAPETLHYWRVTAQNACGDGAASAAFSFTTQAGSLACNGAASAFEDGVPDDWTVVDNTGGTGIVWTTTADSAACGIENRTNGSGEAACADSDAAGLGAPPYDTELVSNFFDLAGFDSAILDVAAYYRDLGSANDHFQVDLWDGLTWQSLLSWDEDHEPEDISLDLSTYAGQTGLRVRFRYFGNGWDWYAQVDDVKLICASTAAPAIEISPGQLSGVQYADTTFTHTLTISNLGAADLHWTVWEEETTPDVACAEPGDVRWASTWPSEGVTPPGHGAPISVLFDTAGMEAGDHHGVLCVSSDDPNHPVMSVPLTVMVMTCPDFEDPDGVGVEDVIAVAERWGQHSAGDDWNPLYDLNGDGVISVVDVMLVSA